MDKVGWTHETISDDAIVQIEMQIKLMKLYIL